MQITVKPVLSGHSKRRPKWFSRPIIAYCRSKVLQNAPRGVSAILLTFIKLPFNIKTFVLSCFGWPLKTGFTVLCNIAFPLAKYLCNHSECEMLTISMLGNCSCSVCLQNHIFEIFFQEHYQSVKQFGSRSGTTMNAGPNLYPNCLTLLKCS